MFHGLFCLVGRLSLTIKLFFFFFLREFQFIVSVISLIRVIDLLRRKYNISYIFYSLEQDIILINMCGGVFPTTLGSLGLNPQLILFCFGFSPQ